MVFQWLLMSSTCRATKTTRNLERKSRESMPKKLFCIEISGVFPVAVVFQNNRKNTVFPRKNWSFVEVSRNEKDVKS